MERLKTGAYLVSKHASAASPWTAVWTAGPDAGASIELSVGRYLIGRSPTADIRCDDRALQPHHVLLEVPDHGPPQLTQLTGTTSLNVDGRLADQADGQAIALDSGVALDVGASTLVIDRSSPAKPSAQIRDGLVIRAPRTIPTLEAIDVRTPTEAPARDANAGGLVPALLALAGSAIVAVVLRQPMFVLFGALGATVAVGSWIAQRLAAARKVREQTAIHVKSVLDYQHGLHSRELAARDYRWATVPTVADAVRTLTHRQQDLWIRRGDHSDAYFASIGIGMAGTDTDLPVPVDLGPGCRLGVLGPHAAAVARALVVQLAASCGPADLRVVIVSNQPQRWECLRALPHLAAPGRGSTIVRESELIATLDDLAAHERHILVVTDQQDLLAVRTNPLRRAIGKRDRVGLIVVVTTKQEDSSVSMTHLCRSTLTTALGSLARWAPDVGRTMLPEHIRLVGLGEHATARCASALQNLRDPEDPLSAQGEMPDQLSLIELLQRVDWMLPTAASIAARWSIDDCATPRTVIGLAADGLVDIDLVRDGPHGLIAGTTGSGKSELLRTLVVGMALNSSPNKLTFVLVDYKGGATFDACQQLPHVVGLVTDLDDQLADRALRSLQAELRRREGLLRTHGVADISELAAASPATVMPRLVVVIDEFAALVAEQPSFLHALVGVAQRGRSLGVHLILATQRPSGVISDDIRSNTNLRIALRLQDAADALDVVGTVTPAKLPRGLPGRVVVRLGAEDHLTFQAAQCTTSSATSPATELAALVGSICDAARIASIEAPESPWQPPLPAVLNSLPDYAEGAVGLIDEPDRQRRSPLQWTTSDGHLAVVGSAGSGVTSALLTIAGSVLHTATKHDLYVIDARGDDRWDNVEANPRCVALVRLREVERLQRLLHRLRTRDPRDGPPVLLIIDGLDALRRSLDDLDTMSEYHAVESILSAADDTEITIVAGAEQATALPMAFLVRCPARWVLHLNDAHDAALLGVGSAQVPPAVPGRVALAGNGTSAQLLAPSDKPRPSTTASSSRSSTPPITIVPSIVDEAELTSSRAVERATLLTLGVDFTSGEPCVLEVPDGEHLLLVGPARSGRSAGLARIATAWTDAHGTSWVGAVLPRRSTFPTSLAARVAIDPAAIGALLDELAAQLARRAVDDSPLLLVVDDAESVDDPGNRLADLAATASGLCIVAAGRPDALKQTYGHWTSVLRRSRLGIVATGGSELDGDLLGTQLPRRTPIAPRAGLVWVVEGGTPRLTQLATRNRRAIAADNRVSQPM